MNKAVSGVMLTSLLISMLVLAFNIQPVKAGGTIHIMADGSIDPPTAPIQRDGDIYTFTDNIYDTIIIEKSNITIDGKGYTLQGSGAGEGFALSGINNVTIINTNINHYHYGVYLSYSDNDTFSNNTITDNDYAGVRLYSSSGNTFSNNTITNSSHGVHLRSSSDSNTFSSNIITDNDHGVRLNHASGNMFSSNTITNSRYGVYLYFASVNMFSSNTITNNNYCGVRLYSSSGNTFSNNTITNSRYYFIVRLGYASDNNTFSNNIITDYVRGVSIYSSGNNTFSNNTILKDTTSPTISVLSPQFKRYPANDVSLAFTVSESTSWMGYSLDGQANVTTTGNKTFHGYSLDGQKIVTTTGNKTLSDLSDGLHNITVYANDTYGNMGASEMVYFNIETPQPFPTWIIAVIVIIAVFGVALPIYFTKVRKTT